MLEMQGIRSEWAIADELIAHVQVYAIATFYDIPGLMKVALRKFRESLKDPWQKEDFISVTQEIRPR